MRKTSIASIFIFMAASVLSADTLAQLIEKAKNNDGLNAQMMETAKADAVKSSELRGYSPKLELIGGYYKKANGVVFEPKEVKTGELRASMALFDGLRRDGAIKSASKNAEAQRYKTEFTKQNIMLDIIREYYSYFDALSALEAVKFKLSELEQNIKKLTILTTNGLATKDTLEAMVASKKEAEFDKENISLSLENSLLKLELYTNSNVGELSFSTLPEIAVDKAERADIKADKLAVEALRYNEWQSTYLPTLSIQDSYKKSKYSAYDDMGGLQRQPEYNNELSLQLSFTLFDFGKISKDREAARFQTLSAAKNLAYKESSAKIETRLKKIELSAAKTKLEAAKAGLEATSTAYEYSKKRFDANLISYTDYLSELTKKQDAYMRAKAAEDAVELKKAELAFAMGIDINTLIKGN
jgi:outer membrane protein